MPFARFVSFLYFKGLIQSLFMEPLSVVLVDDHPIMLEGVKTLIANEDRLQVVHAASNAKDVLVYLSRHKADLIISDLSLPDVAGLQLIKMIKERYPDLKIIVLSMHDEPHLVKDVLKEGVQAYVLKRSTHEDLLKAVHRVMEGKTFVSEDITGLLMQDYTQPEGQKLLTSREREILQLIAQEFSNREIADKLFISERTVETHRKNIFRKTNTNSIVGLMKFAYANQLL
jgi:DNA-binding NarL/FixJ family response regulator